MAKKKKNIPEEALAYITATFNNTLLTITDQKGNPLLTGSTGRVGFSGTKKSTAYAAAQAAKDVAERAQKLGIERVKVLVKGPGTGRNAAIKALGSALKVVSIKDITPIPHNGPRPPKRRRV